MTHELSRDALPQFEEALLADDADACAQHAAMRRRCDLCIDLVCDLPLYLQPGLGEIQWISDHLGDERAQYGYHIGADKGVSKGLLLDLQLAERHRNLRHAE